MTTYIGVACRICGTTEKILGTKRCVYCRRKSQREYHAREREKKQLIEKNKQAAIVQKARIYEGAACSRCHNVHRYIKSNNCVTCTRSNMIAYYGNVTKHKTPEERWAELKPRFFDTKTDDEFRGRGFWI